MSALRRPAAARGGAHRGRAPAGPARGAGARERVALGGAVALAAATGNVTGRDTRSQHALGPTDPDLARRRLPPGFVLAKESGEPGGGVVTRPRKNWRQEQRESLKFDWYRLRTPPTGTFRKMKELLDAERRLSDTA